MPDGSCEEAKAVLHAHPNGSASSQCTQADPCSLAHAISVARDPQTTVRLSEGTYTFATALEIYDKTLVLFGRDAVIDRDGTDGPTILIGENSDVQMYYVSVVGAAGVSGADGIKASGAHVRLHVERARINNNQGFGINFGGTELTVVGSEIMRNGAGGLDIDEGVFRIVGNTFVLNGGNQSRVGGVYIAAAVDARNRLEFNSFAYNGAAEGFAAGIQCTGPLVARNNILAINGTGHNNEQIGGTCKHAYSIVRQSIVPDGPGNSAADPRFANPLVGDLHLLPGSAALNAADPASNLDDLAARDIDGQQRSAPADIGADEVP